MDSEALPPIPTPPGQRWREFRIRTLPLFVFVVILVGMILMWTTYIQPVAIVGLVETNSVNVTTTVAGLLTKLDVNRFDHVTKGQILGEVAAFDAEQIQAELTAIESGAFLVKARLELNELTSADAAVELRLNLLREHTLLNMARTNLIEAEMILETDKELIKGPAPAISKLQFEKDRANRDALKSEVADRAKLVEEWSKQVQEMGPVRTNLYAQLETVVKDDILRQQEQLRQLQKPIVLIAPIDGKVSAVLHRAGERVVSGAPILSITSGQSERILAFVRQPINFRPKEGDVVTVHTRTLRRQKSDAQVLKVGTQLESVLPILLPFDRPRPELGLPITLTLPHELNLLPGELVDIKLTKH